jgi:hypothetical protein
VVDELKNLQNINNENTKNRTLSAFTLNLKDQLNGNN